MPPPRIIIEMETIHVPNTPRTHDGRGHKLEEPLQCVKCLQSWPCDVRQLLNVIDDMVVQDA